MKTLIPIAVIILSVYYYMETHKEQSPPVAAVAPTPTPRKVYYHSPLDAPSMRTGTHSGVGYNSKSRYTNWQGSHLSDGAAPRSASNAPAAPDEEDSEPPR